MSKRQASSVRAIKRRIFQIVEKAQPGDSVSFLFDLFIIVLILLNILAIIFQSFNEIDVQFSVYFRYFEVFSVVVFTIEYLLRLWTADLAFPDVAYPRLRYIFSGLAIVDLFAILPFYIPVQVADARFLRVFRMMRLFRLAKIKRYFPALATVIEVIKDSAYQLVASFCVCAFTIFFAGIVMYTAENSAQPDAFPNVVASLWWAVNALTTVGYGDVYPVTAIGKVCASFLSVIGVGVIALPAGIIAAGFLKALERPQTETTSQTETPKACPHCGKRIE